MPTFPNTDLYGVIEMFWGNYCLHQFGILVILLLIQLEDTCLTKAGIGKIWSGYIIFVYISFFRSKVYFSHSGVS